MISNNDASNGWDNGTVIDRHDLAEDLAVFRVKPDGDLFDFLAGQYTVIGLPGSAPRFETSDPDDDEIPAKNKLIRRAYSIASSSKINEYVELYVTLVRSGELTPRLWLLRPGDRIWLGPSAKGHFTMDDVPPDKNVVLIGTGTGLAPYIAMIGDHHRCNIGRRFVVVHGARYVRELGYRQELEALDRDCGTLVYVPTVSRPDAKDGWSGHVGRVQSVFADGTIAAALGEALSPDKTHVFVSGNPDMVEEIQRDLIEQAYSVHSTRSPGTLHVERYW
jgi:ferredoxin--NADP+ reductase